MNELIGFTEITNLKSLMLREPITVLIEKDGDDEYIVEYNYLDLYGSGRTPDEAIEMFQRELESYWEELKSSDIHPSLISVKEFLNGIIMEKDI